MKEQLNVSIENLMLKLSSWFDTLIINLPNLFIAALVFMISYFLAKKLSSRITRLLENKIKQGSIRSLIGSIISTIILGLGFILILGILNLDQALNSLIAGAGVAGLAIGLAIQGTLSNTFAGISLALKNDININDFVETNGFAGTIAEINLRDTKIRTIDNNLVIIPNNSISNNPFKNYSLTKDLRVVIESGVGYESDLRKVELIAKSAIAEYFSYRKEEIDFYYLSFGDSAINFQIRFWIEATEKSTLIQAKSEAIILLKEKFDAENINIPYPIRTILSAS